MSELHDLLGDKCLLKVRAGQEVGVEECLGGDCWLKEKMGGPMSRGAAG